jgi:hypothetical protein
MALTFKSTGQETLVVIDRAPDGRQRVGRAIQSEHNAKFWDIRIEHPNGNVQRGTYCGGKYEAGVAIADLMNRSANDYEQERARGDRPPAEAYDGNVRVNDMTNAPIVPINRRF